MNRTQSERITVRWEYKTALVMRPPPKRMTAAPDSDYYPFIDEVLREHGAAGWELVAVNGDFSRSLLYFKRLLP